MRIKSSVTAFIAGLALSLSACAPEAELVDETGAVSVETQAPSDPSVSAMAVCKLAWTCDGQRYYTTQSLCTTACGGIPCDQDYACNRSCICP